MHMCTRTHTHTNTKQKHHLYHSHRTNKALRTNNKYKQKQRKTSSVKPANIGSTHFPDATSFISQFHKDGNTTAEHRYGHSLSLSPATTPGVCLFPALKGSPSKDASRPKLFSISVVVLSIFWQQKHSSVSIFHLTEALFCFYFPFLWLFCQYFGNRSTLLIQIRAPRSSGHSHVGLLFTNEEQERVGS